MKETNTKRRGLFDAAGNRVPGIPTILAKFKDPGALLHWAWKLGADGTTLDQAYKVRTAGHVAADRAFALLAGQQYDYPPEDQDVVTATDRALEAFATWADEHALKLYFRDAEKVSEEWHFGGVVSIATVDGARAVLSLKAGKGLYLEDVLTAAASACLAETDRALLIRFGKDSGGFDECRLLKDVELFRAWELFRCLLDAYSHLGGVEQILKGAA